MNRFTLSAFVLSAFTAFAGCASETTDSEHASEGIAESKDEKVPTVETDTAKPNAVCVPAKLPTCSSQMVCIGEGFCRRCWCTN